MAFISTISLKDPKFYHNNKQLLKFVNTILIPYSLHVMKCIFRKKNKTKKLLVYVKFFQQKALFNLTKNLDLDLKRK